MTTEIAYGQWVTINGERYMVTDWTKNTVTVWKNETNLVFDKSVVSQRSDFKMTDAERKAAGFAY